MNSKKRPQLLAFENASHLKPNHICHTSITGGKCGGLVGSLCDTFDDTFAFDTCQNLPRNEIRLMFKKGDDLRQDRLTLQLLAVMDRLWKGAGMTLKYVRLN